MLLDDARFSAARPGVVDFEYRAPAQLFGKPMGSGVVARAQEHDLLDPRETRPRLCDWVEEIQAELQVLAASGPLAGGHQRHSCQPTSEVTGVAQPPSPKKRRSEAASAV